MAVAGWEVLAIIGVLVVLLVWGPGQLPKLARSVGLAKKEFDKTKEQFQHPLDEKKPEA